MSRAAVTRSITQTKQAGTLAALRGIRSHLLGPLGVQKAIRGISSGWMINGVKKIIREKVEYRENQSRHRGNKDLIGAGDRNRVNSVTLLLLFSYLTVVRMEPDFFVTHMRGLHHEHVEG